MSKKLNYEDLQSVKEALTSATNAVNEAMIAEAGGVGAPRLSSMASLIGMENHIRAIMEKHGSSNNEEFHSVLRGYVNFINESEDTRPRDERIYKQFLESMKDFRYLKGVKEAYDSIRSAVNKDKVGVEVIAILDELKSDPLFKYFYEAIEEPAMIFLLERNDIAKNNAIKALRDYARQLPIVGRLLHIIKEGRLPEDANETESAISSDSNLSQETPISPVFTNPKGVAMFLYGGAFFAKSDTSVRPITREEYEELPQDLRQIASLEAKGLISYDENPSGEARVEYYTTSGSVFTITRSDEGKIGVLLNDTRLDDNALVSFDLFSQITSINDYSVFNNVTNVLTKLIDGTYEMAELDFATEYSKLDTYGRTALLINLKGMYFIITYDASALDPFNYYSNLKPSGVPPIFSQFFGKTYISINENTKKADKKRIERYNKRKEEFESQITKLIEQRKGLKEVLEEGAGANEDKVKGYLGSINNKLNKLKKEYEAFQEEEGDVANDGDNNRYKQDDAGVVFYNVSILDKGVTPDEISTPLGDTANAPEDFSSDEEVPDNYLSEDYDPTAGDTNIVGNEVTYKETQNGSETYIDGVRVDDANADGLDSNVLVNMILKIKEQIGDFANRMSPDEITEENLRSKSNSELISMLVDATEHYGEPENMDTFDANALNTYHLYLNERPIVERNGDVDSVSSSDDGVQVLDIKIKKEEDGFVVAYGVVRLDAVEDKVQYKPFVVNRNLEGKVFSYYGGSDGMGALSEDTTIPMFVFNKIQQALDANQEWNSGSPVDTSVVTPEENALPEVNSDYLGETPIEFSPDSFEDESAVEDPASFFESVSIVSKSKDGKVTNITEAAAVTKRVLESEQIDFSKDDEGDKEPETFEFSALVDVLEDGDEYYVDEKGVFNEGDEYEEIEYVVLSDEDDTETRVLFHVNDPDSEFYEQLYISKSKDIPQGLENGGKPLLEILGLVSDGEVSVLGIESIEDGKADPMNFIRASFAGVFIDGTDEMLDDLQKFDGSDVSINTDNDDPYTDDIEDAISVTALDKNEGVKVMKQRKVKDVQYIPMNESAGEKVSTFVAGDKVLVDGKKVGTIVSQEGENSLVKLFSGNETERIPNKRIRLITRVSDLYETAYSKQAVRERMTMDNFIPCSINYGGITGIIQEGKVVRFSDYVGASEGTPVKVYDEYPTEDSEPTYVSKEYINPSQTASDILNSMNFADGVLMDREMSTPIAPVSVDKNTFDGEGGYVSVIVHTAKQEDNHIKHVPFEDVLLITAPNYVM